MKYIAPKYILTNVETEDVITFSPGIIMGGTPEGDAAGLVQGEARVEVDIKDLF